MILMRVYLHTGPRETRFLPEINLRRRSGNEAPSFSVEQIVAAVKQQELGTSAADIGRKLGVADQTFYRWKKCPYPCIRTWGHVGY